MNGTGQKRPQVPLFSKIPIGWIQAGGLADFGYRLEPNGPIDVAYQNNSIAALKLYVTLCIRTDFRTGEVRTTYDELIALSGMSRPIIAKALKRLLYEKLITKRSMALKEGSIFYINGWLEYSSYGMIPKRWLFDGNQGRVILKLQEFRYSKLFLNALRIYLLLIGFRNSKQNGLAILPYTSIARLTGVPRHLVAESITLLYDMNLISYRQADFSMVTENEIDRTNRYLVRGLNTTWSSIQSDVLDGKKKSFKKTVQHKIKASNEFVAGSQ